MDGVGSIKLGLRRAAVGIAVTAVVLIASGLGATTARALSLTTGCTGLQAALNQAQNGDTITLTEMCPAGGSPADFNLDNGTTRSYTLQAQPGSGAGFDGTTATTSMVHANSGSGTITVRNLVFRNAPAAPNRNGGALVFQGGYSVTIDGDTFTNNQVGGGGSGGGLDVETTASSANVTLTNNTFTNNQAAGSGLSLGGAVNVLIQGAAGTVTFAGDTFSGNQSGVGGGAVEVTSLATSGSLAISNSTSASAPLLCR